MVVTAHPDDAEFGIEILPPDAGSFAGLQFGVRV